MDKIIRRQALRSLGGGGLAAMLLAGGDAATREPHVAARDGSAGNSSDQGVLVQGTLTLEHAAGRRLCGFIETGIRDGIALCSLVRQAEGNPAVESVFASPEQHQGRSGVRVTVSFYSEPVGELTFSLLHLATQSQHAAPVRTV